MNKRLLVGLVALPLFLSAAAAANDCTPSRAGWDDSALSTNIEKRGAETILIVEGQIGPDLPQRLKTLFADHPDIATIHFNSSSGDRASAMAAGHVVRAEGNVQGHVPAGWGCTDACALLFLSTRIRSVDPAAVFDMGRFFEPAGTPAGVPAGASASEIARQSLGISDYLIRMGVSRRLLTGTLDRKAASDGGAPQRRCLTPAELRGYNVANWNE